VAATIEFSAQFGGRDAAAAALPHFKTLKSVASNFSIERFPFKSLAFILRVDGEVNSYDLSGLGHLDFEANNYVSIDLGVKREDYGNCSDCLSSSISSALKSSGEFLRRSDDARLMGIDFDSLEETIYRLVAAYEEALNK
jgi:hypothetical protein